MMHRIYSFLVALIVCPSVFADGLLDCGVSEALAQWRYQQIADVHYDLHFRLPACKDEAVTGELLLSFRKAKAGDVVVDFCGTIDNNVCSVDGRAVRCELQNEHLVFADSMLSVGEEHTIVLRFTSQDAALNRRDGYLYTLFVPDRARTAYPCFDQPDLKARYTLTLTLPADWEALSAGRVTVSPYRSQSSQGGGIKTLHFSETLPLPTYLFSFTAGRFKKYEATRNGRLITALYLETDSAKVAQLPQVLDEVSLSLEALEDYTGMACPFPDYGLCILPAYQFGGMEHPGAIQLIDHDVFLDRQPTLAERFRRLELIAHETAHLWFGDCVTMRWFDDVWTKEVFANFLAAKVARRQFPSLDYNASFLRVYKRSALSTDRTLGTHPIRQSLSNLNRAGLLYGNIIYKKAPCVMRQLETLLGEDGLRDGLRRYLERYAYANATWDELVACLDEVCPGRDVKSFSRAWVYEGSLPRVEVALNKTADSLIVRSTAPVAGRWRQQFSVALFCRGEADPIVLPVVLTDTLQCVPLSLPSKLRWLLPDCYGTGYGQFVADAEMMKDIGMAIPKLPEAMRLPAMMTVFENWKVGVLTTRQCYMLMMFALMVEMDEQRADVLCQYLRATLPYLPMSERSVVEFELFEIGRAHPEAAVRKLILRMLSTNVLTEEGAKQLYSLWADPYLYPFAERERMRIAYHLAVLYPESAEQILSFERNNLTSELLRQEFDFVARACTPDTARQAALFHSFLQADNRRPEAWTASALALLCHPARSEQAACYVYDALCALPDVQRTGDIFFPTNWLNALLSGQRSQAARSGVERYLATHPELPHDLRLKFLQAADELLRTTAE
ncbi:MAG: aminopeptidase [Alloprevotella sp.]|nr:aminopeptidase [Alloprevotella sp.]